MDSYSIIVFIFGILILFLLIVLFFVNRLFSYRNRVKRHFDTVLEYLEVRIVLIDEIITFITEHLEHEEHYVKKLKQVKDEIQKLFQDSSSLKEFKKGEKEFLNFNSLEKVYPSLKNRSDYLDLKDEIKLNQDRVVYAMDSYDKGVMDYNNYREKKFVRLVAKIFRFPNYDYYNK